MSGVFYIGLGDQFDGDKVEAYPPGSVIVLPGNTSHGGRAIVAFRLVVHYECHMAYGGSLRCSALSPDLAFDTAISFVTNTSWQSYYRLQAVRGDLPCTGHHHRGGAAAQRRHAAHHPLRHRYDEMHLLRLLPGGLPRRRHRPGTELRVRDRHPRSSTTTRNACSRTATAGSERLRRTSCSTRRIDKPAKQTQPCALLAR
jgi:hypothetical protein